MNYAIVKFKNSYKKYTYKTRLSLIPGATYQFRNDKGYDYSGQLLRQHFHIQLKMYMRILLTELQPLSGMMALLQWLLVAMTMTGTEKKPSTRLL